jgi:hypothetical protein
MSKKSIPPRTSRHANRMARQREATTKKASPTMTTDDKNQNTAAVDRKPAPMGVAGTAAYDRSQQPPASKTTEVVADIRARENQEAETWQRGAGSGENAVLTRSRQYNEDVPGAFPVNQSPTPEQAKAIRDTQEAEDAEKQAQLYKEAPAMIPHSSVEKPKAAAAAAVDKSADKK